MTDQVTTTALFETYDTFEKLLKTHHKKVVYDYVLVESFIRSLRIPFNINKAYINKSDIHGTGVFAKTRIKKGDVITFYPGHYVVYYPKKLNIGNPTEMMIINSDLVKSKNLNINDDIRRIYKIGLNENYAICGDPRIIDNTDFIGHMINDGAKGHSTKDNYNKNDETIYNKISLKINNAYSCGIRKSCLAIIAMRDIDKDEEILMSYDYDYWTEIN